MRWAFETAFCMSEQKRNAVLRCSFADANSALRRPGSSPAVFGGGSSGSLLPPPPPPPPPSVGLRMDESSIQHSKFLFTSGSDQPVFSASHWALNRACSDRTAFCRASSTWAEGRRSGAAGATAAPGFQRTVGFHSSEACCSGRSWRPGGPARPARSFWRTEAAATRGGGGASPPMSASSVSTSSPMRALSVRGASEPPRRCRLATPTA